jgi:hypothetical protein
VSKDYIEEDFEKEIPKKVKIVAAKLIAVILAFFVIFLGYRMMRNYEGYCADDGKIYSDEEKIIAILDSSLPYRHDELSIGMQILDDRKFGPQYTDTSYQTELSVVEIQSWRKSEVGQSCCKIAGPDAFDAKFSFGSKFPGKFLANSDARERYLDNQVHRFLGDLSGYVEIKYVRAHIESLGNDISVLESSYIYPASNCPYKQSKAEDLSDTYLGIAPSVDESLMGTLIRQGQKIDRQSHLGKLIMNAADSRIEIRDSSR